MIDLSNFLLKDLLVVRHMVANRDLVPLETDPALGCIRPVGTLLDLIVSKHSREDNLIHVPSHWVFLQQIEGHLVDAHKHQS